uniref:Ataxin 7 like 1 n=1 Tax=Sinocyclocheilus rhinocerous TaxID=307959 RepID=A0A673KL67_9TELE
MATVAERRSLPSPEIMLGQPWSSWVDAVKLYGSDDMPIFGQCPAQDDFYLVMCSHCSQVVKPQAFQAHYGKNTFCCPHPQRTQAFDTHRQSSVYCPQVNI